MSRLTADVLEGFTNTCLRKHFDDASETPAFHREIWELVTSNFKQIAIAADRKSTRLNSSH